MRKARAGPDVDEATGFVERAAGASWYEDHVNRVDLAVVRLCRLRRAEASERRSAEGGDEAVRRALEQAEPQAVIWLTSRIISYMDEHGFPETVAEWLDPR